MNKLLLQKVERNEEGRIVKVLRQNYKLEDIGCIRTGKYKDFHKEADISGNGVNPDDSCIFIIFMDETEATFGSDWDITFG